MLISLVASSLKPTSLVPSTMSEASSLPRAPSSVCRAEPSAGHLAGDTNTT